MKNSTFTAELRIKAIIDEAQRDLQAFGDSLKKAWANGEPPKSLERAYENMRIRLESLKEFSKKGIVDTSDLHRAEQDYRSFQKDIHNLSVEFKLMSTEQKRAMLSKEEQNAMQARAAAVREYTAALEKNRKIAQQRAPLEKKKEELELDPKRRQAEATIADVSPRLERLKNAGGPLGLSKEAEVYKKTLAEQFELSKRIETTQARIKTLQRQGLKEGGKNELTNTRQELEKLLKEQERFNTLAGKGEYEAALESYNAEVAKLEQSISSATEEIKTMDTALDEIEVGLKKLPLKDMDAEFNTLKQRLKELGVEGIDDAKDIDTLRKAIQKLDNEAIAKVDKEIARLVKELSALETGAQQAKKSMDQTTESIKQQETVLREREAFEGRIKQFLGLSGAATVLRQALRDAMQTITELDATMTEMSVVTDLKVGDYWNQLPQYTERANELGLAINDVYKADTLYYQQGLKTNEVVAISTETMKMAKIANIDTALATDRMTAALRGFNMELNETSAQKISDVYSELAAITAADVKEISAAMTKTASIASSAGMEFETTAAFLSQIIETTRESAETAGTAMKTVIARFQELKKAPSEIGEVDGEIVDANAIETALRNVGVSLRDSSGQFRELDEVFLELSRKWDGLDKNTQRYIATIAAGSRQQSRFIAMMSDYERTSELVAAANNSAGASSKQFEKTVDSLGSKMAKLKNAWHEFTMGILDSDLVKSGVEILTKFLELINKITGALDGVGGALTKIGSVMAIFKMGQVIFEKFKPLINSFLVSVIDDFRRAGYESGRQYARAVGQGVSGEKLPTNREAPTGTVGRIDNTGKNLGGKLVGGFSNFGLATLDAMGVGHFQDAININSQRKNARANMKAAREDFNKANILTKEEKDSYYSAQETLKGYTKGENGHTYKLDENGKRRKLKGNEKEIYEGAAKEVENYEEKVKALEEAQANLESSTEEFGATSKKQWGSICKGLESASMAAAGVGMAFGVIGDALTDAGFEEAGEVFNKLGNGMMIVSTIAGSLSAILPLISTGFGAAGAAGATSGAITTAAWGPVGLIVGAALAVILVAVVAVMAVLNEIKKNSPEQKLKEAEAAAEGAAKAADAATESYNNLNNSLENLGDKYDTLKDLTRGTEEWNKAVQDINNEVLDLIEQYPELSKFLESKSGVLTLNLDDEKLQEIKINAQAVTIATQNASNRASAVVALMQGQQELEGIVDSYAAEIRQTTYEETQPAAFQRNQGTIPSGLDPAGWVGAYIGAWLESLIEGTIEATEASAEITETLTLDNSMKEALARGLAKGWITNVDGQFKVAADSIKEFEAATGVSAETINNLDSGWTELEYSLKELGSTIIETEERIRASWEASATTAKGLIKFEHLEDGQKDWAYKYLDSVLSGEDYQELYNKELEKINISSDTERNSIVRTIFGDGATLNDKGEVVNTKGEVLATGVDDEYLKSYMADLNATKKFAASGESVYGMVSTIKKFSNDNYVSDTTIDNLFTNKEGLNLTQTDLAQLEAFDDNALWTFWENFTDEQKNLFGGDGNKFIEYVRHATENVDLAFSDAAKILGLGEGYQFQGTTAGAAKKIANTVTETEMTNQNKASFVRNYNNVITGLTPEQQLIFSQQVAGMGDASKRENWEALLINLEKNGIDINNESIRQFINAAKEQTSSTYSDTWLKQMGVSETLVSHYQEALAKAEESGDQKTVEGFHKSFKQWREDYNIANDEAAKSEHELIVQITDKLVENLEKEIELQEVLIDTTNEANERLVDSIQQQIDSQRQERGNAETEQNISDMYSQLAYLGMDTSSGGTLEELSLREEIAAAEQEYQDTLVDQAIQQLQDDNEKAAEQRERQIEIANSQLEAYKTSNKIYENAKEILNTTKDQVISGVPISETSLGSLFDGQVFESEWEKATFWTGLATEVAKTIPNSRYVPTIEEDKDKESRATPKNLINTSLEKLSSNSSEADISSTYARLLQSLRERGLETFATLPEEEGGLGLTYEWFVNLVRNGTKFATGGLADFTGPAWLDGTPSKPEYILNAQQTERFFSLIDVLESFDEKDKPSSSGDNYFEIEINVEKLESDYDVEKIANKIRSMIYEDASYRNVNTINLIH